MIWHEPMGMFCLAGQVREHGVVIEEDTHIILEKTYCAQQDK